LRQTDGWRHQAQGGQHRRLLSHSENLVYVDFKTRTNNHERAFLPQGLDDTRTGHKVIATETRVDPDRVSKQNFQECWGSLYRHVLAVLIIGRVASVWVEDLAFPLIG
jgi:hypothetical protein